MSLRASPAKANPITVKVIAKDNSGRIKLSRKATLDGKEDDYPDDAEDSKPEIDVNIGDVITGKVVNIAKFGAFVEIAPGVDGMVHISELETYRIARVDDVVSVGEEITVKVIDVAESGDRIKLSRKALLTD